MTRATIEKAIDIECGLLSFISGVALSPADSLDLKRDVLKSALKALLTSHTCTCIASIVKNTKSYGDNECAAYLNIALDRALVQLNSETIVLFNLAEAAGFTQEAVVGSEK